MGNFTLNAKQGGSGGGAGAKQGIPKQIRHNSVHQQFVSPEVIRNYKSNTRISGNLIFVPTVFSVTETLYLHCLSGLGRLYFSKGSTPPHLLHIELCTVREAQPNPSTTPCSTDVSLASPFRLHYAHSANIEASTPTPSLKADSPHADATPLYSRPKRHSTAYTIKSIHSNTPNQ